MASTAISAQAAPVQVTPASGASRAVPAITDSRPTRLSRLRCDAWTFVPPAITHCGRSVRDSVVAARRGNAVYAFSTKARAWVEIPYAWNSSHRLLEFDATRIHVPPPVPERSTVVWRYLCTAWTLVSESGPTTCKVGRPEHVTVKVNLSGTNVRVLNPVTHLFEASPYVWQRLGGYLVLDARLVPAASVDLGLSMSPRPTPDITDYVVRCDVGHVHAAITARAGGTVQFDDNSIATASTNSSASLTPGQSVKWTLTLPGRSPIQQVARCLPSNFVTWATSRTGTPQSQWYFFSPSVGIPIGVTGRYAVVTDNRGTPVWWKNTDPDVPIDVCPLGSNRIAWAIAYGGFSFGSSRSVMGWDGQVQPPIGATLGIDEHDLVPLPNGHYLAIRYQQKTCAEVPHTCDVLASHGLKTGDVVLEGQVIEFDAAENIVWSWSTHDHIAIEESAAHFGVDLNTEPGIIGPTAYWDPIHINSVEPDGDGIIVSSRNTDAVYRIDKATGNIDWKLSGTTTAASLTLAGTGHSPLTSSQHDVRVLGAGRYSLFDNESNTTHSPRALVIQVNAAARTMQIVSQITDARVPYSGCCGSVRHLSGGNVVISWGGIPQPNASTQYSGLITETDAAGRPVISMRSPFTFTYRAIPVEPGIVSRADLIAGMDAQFPRSP